MDTPHQIAKKFTSGQKVTVSEARQLAAVYLRNLETIEKLQRQVNELQGGETVTLKSNAFAKEVFDPADSYISQFTRANGRSGGFEQTLMWELRDLLSQNVHRENIHDTALCILTGPIERIKKFLRINKIITHLLQAAYNEGHKDGRSLLFGLAEGTLSVKDFNSMENHAG